MAPDGDTRRRMPAPLRIAAHLLVAGLVLEIAARIEDRVTFGAPLWGPYGPEILRGTDSWGIPRNLPGARFEKWRINRLGFRGGEIQREKPPGTRRIVCLGQSESFGMYESEDGEWPARLRALLSPRGGVDVVNASVVGLGRTVRRPYLEAYVLPLHPDVVVLFVNVLSEMGAPRAGEAATRSEGQRLAGARSRFLPKLKLEIQAAVPTLWARLHAWRLEREVRKLQRAELGDRPPADVVPPENVLAFEDHLRDLVGAARSRGATPVLVTYPVLADERSREVFHVQIADEQRWHPQWSELGLLDGQRKLNEAVIRIGREQGVPVVDLAAALPRTLEYFADDVHYTDRGAAVVAERVLAALDQAGLLGAPATAPAARALAPRAP